MNLSAFLSYTFLTAYTPGPNNIMAMTNASRDGFRCSLYFILGIFSGFIIVMTTCAAFTALLYEFIPTIRPVMVWLGATYIIWLAWTVWRDKPSKKKNGVT